MTSITSSMSPGLSMMDARIGRAAAVGRISSTDQTALESAMTSIDGALSPSATSGTGTDMKTRIDSLIQDHVSSGTLTSGQASELKGMFAHGGHGHHGGGGGGGESTIAALVGSTDSGTTTATDDGTTTDSLDAIASTGAAGSLQAMQGPPPPPDDIGPSSAPASSVSVASVSGSSEQKALDTLIGFLQNLRSSVAGNSYGSSAITTSANAGALIDLSA